MAVGVLLGGCVSDLAEPEPVPGVSHIHGGDEASPCQWPTIVALLDAQGQSGCSGTLIHPQFILTAAHCVAEQDPALVVFGEDVTAPATTRSVQWCERHPAYESASGPSIDLAVCALDSPVVGVQIVPPLQGCERDALRSGAATMIAGFGNTQSWIEDDEYVDGVGAGLKRFIAQSVYEIRASAEEADLVAIGTPGGGCHGDSGGGAFIQLADGTWRLFGVAEALFDPEIVPSDEAGACGTGTIYSLVSDRLPWIELITQKDVTPCFTSGAQWDPSEQCDSLPLQPGYGHGSWASSCQGPLGGELLCEPPVEPEPPQLPEPEPETDDASTGGGTDADEASTGIGSTGLEEGSSSTGSAPDDIDDEPVPSQDVIQGTCSLGGGRSHAWWLALLWLIRARKPKRS